MPSALREKTLWRRVFLRCSWLVTGIAEVSGQAVWQIVPQIKTTSSLILRPSDYPILLPKGPSILQIRSCGGNTRQHRLDAVILNSTMPPASGSFDAVGVCRPAIRPQSPFHRDFPLAGCWREACPRRKFAWFLGNIYNEELHHVVIGVKLPTSGRGGFSNLDASSADVFPKRKIHFRSLTDFPKYGNITSLMSGYSRARLASPQIPGCCSPCAALSW